METIALLGATGAMGRAMGRALSQSGRRYRAVSRSQMGLQVRVAPDPLASPVVWEPEEPSSVAAALQGIETAVYLVGMPVWAFEKHLALTDRVLAGCREQGVRRLLLVSSNWAYGLAQAERVTERHPMGAHTAKGRVRAEQERRVLAAHSPDLKTAVLRAAEFYGPYVEASHLWSAFRAAKNGAHAQLMSPAETPHEFVYVRDAARTALQMLETPAVWGRPWNLGGVGVTTLRAMSEAIFAAAGRPANYEIPPAWKMRVVAMMNPYVREMREMQYLLERPLLLDDSALAEALGGLVKTPYDEGIRETLETVRAGR